MYLIPCKELLLCFQTRSIMANVISFFRLEEAKKGLLFSVSNPLERAAAALKCSMRIIKKFEKEIQPRDPVDEMVIYFIKPLSKGLVNLQKANINL